MTGAPKQRAAWCNRGKFHYFMWQGRWVAENHTYRVEKYDIHELQRTIRGFF